MQSGTTGRPAQPFKFLMSHWSLFVNRTGKVLRDNTAKMLRMQGADAPTRSPITLFSFNSQSDVNQFVTGSDADIGGHTTAYLDLGVSSEQNGSNHKSATARFWGNMSLDVKPDLEGRVRAGYAGFRSQRRRTLFGDLFDDVSNHRYLALRLRLGGDTRARNSYFVNLQTDGPIATDLWQHRLYFRRTDGGWEDLFIPFQNFVLTNAGELASHQITMYREKVRTVGISLLGGNSRFSGPYELGIDSIRAVNEEDVIQLEEKDPSPLIHM